MELTNIPYLASSSSSSFFYSSYSCCTCRGRRAGKLVKTVSAAGGRCAADLARSQLFEQENEDTLSGPSSCHYRRREFASAILLPFLLPHVDISSATETYDISVIRSGVRKVLTKAKAAGVLRLVFHDAGTFDVSDKSGGMNGSIIYEVDRPENTGLNRSIKILGKAKAGIDKIQKVSWADLIAVAGAEAVALCGGPKIPVRLGRLDSSTADPAGKLPEETLDAAALKTSFSTKGFSRWLLYLEHTQLEAKVSEVRLFSITPITKCFLRRSHKHLRLVWKQWWGCAQTGHSLKMRSA
ncbi:unnamed protein product [Urochloa decumbens]|uniref:Plant heme peroxidase family profile domain-containing protein n=1 Tax=Urochloa decumbens TaxID=240449 RepID=A0ABC9BHP4_9POAL